MKAEYVKCDSSNPVFIENCRLLDEDLDRRVGKEIQRDKYNKYNQIDKIRECIVVYADGKPVGGGAIRAYDAKRTELKRVFVRPEYQGRGIGTQLVKRLLSWAADLDYESVILETGELLKESCHVYKKLGFKIIPNYGPYVNMPESLCMERKLCKLRAFEDKDIDLFREWLYREHVAKWYIHPDSWLDEISKRHTEYSFVKHFIVEKGGKPVGFCQFYDYALGGETWHGDREIASAYSIDYMIGEVDCLRQGLGTSIVRELLEKIRSTTDAKIVIVQPEPENTASRNTLLSAGLCYDEQNDVFFIEF